MAVALAARCMPPPAAVFLDPITRERIKHDDRAGDVCGVDLVGVDEDGAWIGTPRALLALGGDRYFAANGYLGALKWDAYIAARTEADVELFAVRLEVRDLGIQPVALSTIDLDWGVI